MKYLKKFNEGTSVSKFVKIDKEEFELGLSLKNSNIYSHKYDRGVRDTYDMENKSDYNPRWNHQVNFSYKYYKLIEKRLDSKYSIKRIYDEQYYLEIMHKSDVLVKIYERPNDWFYLELVHNSFYKCEYIEGLVECLENFGFIDSSFKGKSPSIYR